MDSARTTPATADTAAGIAAAVTGIGLIIFALFPLAIPFLLLTAAFAAPLVLLLLAAALPLAFLAGIVLAIRGIGRRLRGRSGSRAPAARTQSATSPTARERRHAMLEADTRA
jgi:hypothetical protein